MTTIRLKLFNIPLVNSNGNISFAFQIYNVFANSDEPLSCSQVLKTLNLPSSYYSHCKNRIVDKNPEVFIKVSDKYPAKYKAGNLFNIKED